MNLDILVYGPAFNDTIWINVTFSRPILSTCWNNDCTGFNAASDKNSTSPDNRMVIGLNGVAFLKTPADTKAHDKYLLSYWYIQYFIYYFNQIQAFTTYVEYDYDVSHQLCVIDIACGTNQTRSSVETMRSTDDANDDFLPSTHIHTFNTELSYRSGFSCKGLRGQIR